MKLNLNRFPDSDFYDEMGDPDYGRIAESLIFSIMAENKLSPDEFNVELIASTDSRLDQEKLIATVREIKEKLKTDGETQARFIQYMAAHGFIGNLLDGMEVDSFGLDAAKGMLDNRCGCLTCRSRRILFGLNEPKEYEKGKTPFECDTTVDEEAWELYQSGFLPFALWIMRASTKEQRDAWLAKNGRKGEETSPLADFWKAPHGNA